MKILYVTTIGITMVFFKSFIRQLLDEGHTVDIATNESSSKVPDCYRDWNCKIHQIETSRSPLDKGNLKAVKQLKALVGREKYDLVHCHTPVAAMCTRIACRKFRKNGTKVFYTAHGFHFHKSAPLKNWLLYYPVERYLARWTDVLITICHEDYRHAKKFKGEQAYLVPGMGIDTKRFLNRTNIREKKRCELGFKETDIVILSVGELSIRKNHRVIIKALAKLKNPNIHYVICGQGSLYDEHNRLINEMNLSEQVTLAGFCDNVEDYCCMADIFAFPSYQEGLGLAAIEAMACGLPIITSNVHGINDYSQDGITGYKCSPDDVDAFADAINKLYSSPKMRHEMGVKNKMIAQNYDINKSLEAMMNIYRSELHLSEHN